MPDDVIKLNLPATCRVPDALRCFASLPDVVLLDSTSRVRARDARYSFLTGDAVQTVRLERVEHGDQPLHRLRRWHARLPELLDETLPPFCGGIAGLMSYELGEAFEVLPRPATDDFHTPALVAGLYDWCLCWDHIRDTVTAYVLVLQPDDQSAPNEDVTDFAGSELRSATVNPARAGEDGRAVATRRLAWIQQRLAISGRVASTGSVAVATSADEDPSDSRPDAPWVPMANATDSPVDSHVAQYEIQPGVYSPFSPSQYVAAVDRVVEYIRAGDIFQANLSQRLSARWTGSAVELFQRVRLLNPAPFCGLLIQPDFAVVSASPERFLKVSQGRFVETRPIKGTRRRQKSPIADLFTTDELISSEKDRAENVMIVDLLRNDLSRSCRAGSVKVSGLCEVELFETVQHLVSTVVGELCADKDVWDLCAGCFPGGSITGAPKIRAMQIIAELEPVVRGAYCGCLFYCGPQGDFDSSILIRTFTLKNGWLQFPVGGGIVADSEAADEYRETLHKASGMLRVLAGS